MRIEPADYRHPYHWLTEPLMLDPSYVEKRMFGALACYLHGKLVLVLSAQNEEPWNGIMIPADRDFHPSILAERPELINHPILGKWLYISESHDRFETVARWAVERIAEGDERFGTVAKRKKKRKPVQKKTLKKKRR